LLYTSLSIQTNPEYGKYNSYRPISLNEEPVNLTTFNIFN